MQEATDMPNRTTSTPAQHTPLPPQIDRLQQSPEMQANTPLELGMPEESVAAVPSATEAAEASIISSLQQVLRQLKSASMERPVLREVEDLLFEIRTEAQNAVGRERTEQ
jgi:hypothetical protein